MAKLRVALAQVNPTVGDLGGNADVVLRYARQAQQAGAQLIAFPEMMLTGYPIEDLAFRQTFVDASQSALAELAAKLAADGLGEIPVIIGYFAADGPVAPGPRGVLAHGARNAAAIVHKGQIITSYYKHHLPNYGVFDEDRYFVAGNRLPILRLSILGSEVGADVDIDVDIDVDVDVDVDIATVICEDIWQDGGPIASCAEAQVDLVVCINGSPYEQHKDDTRLELCQRRAAQAGATLAYVNMVGGQDELVFDGDSLIVSADGQLLARAGQFTEELLLADLELPAATSQLTGLVGEMTVERIALSAPSYLPDNSPGSSLRPRLSDLEEVWTALRMGLRDYVRKNGFSSVIMGLSGGIDSAVCAALAADALGAPNVHGVAMPSSYSSPHSLSDAAELAQRLGLPYRVIPIEMMLANFQAELSLTGMAEENLQARVRGVILMGLSNQEGHLVLATGNKSEYAVGYSTLYGDAVGGFAPLKDVRKTLVWELARWRNRHAVSRGQNPPIPENSITKQPSAELRPGQFDSDSLPSYEVLDPILARYVDGDMGREELLSAGFPAETVDQVIQLVDKAEYKRRQTAPGTKITLKAFGRDRRLPITNRWRQAT